MPQYDLPESMLVTYRSRAQPPSDLNEFWERTLAEGRRASRPAELRPVDTGLGLVATWDVTLTGFEGDPVRAWYHRPAGTSDDLPIVVRYHGYGGGRGLPHEVGLWTLAGYACLEVDTRGQGSQAGARGAGETPDAAAGQSARPGYVTRGILDPDTYYYRRVFTDAVLAVESAATLPGVDGERIVVTGASQGGGISVAVAALAPYLTAVMVDTPFLSDFRRGAEIADSPPYSELRAYLAARPDHVDRAFDTLSYFDVSILALRARAPALFSVALMDTVCPPSTVYAAYNAYAGPKQIRAYPFNDHEGGHAFHQAEQLHWLSALMPSTPVDLAKERVL
jgi:cephalosporin-C deacetylase